MDPVWVQRLVVSGGENLHLKFLHQDLSRDGPHVTACGVDEQGLRCLWTIFPPRGWMQEACGRNSSSTGMVSRNDLRVTHKLNITPGSAPQLHPVLVPRGTLKDVSSRSLVQTGLREDALARVPGKSGIRHGGIRHREGFLGKLHAPVKTRGADPGQEKGSCDPPETLPGSLSSCPFFGLLEQKPSL